MRDGLVLPLTRRDQLLAKRYLVRGEAGLIEDGLTPSQMEEFLSRIEVQEYLRTLYYDFTEKTARRERVNYFALTELERLIPQAIAVVAKSLTGFTFGDEPDLDESGKQKSDELGNPVYKPTNLPPSEQQYKAASDLLDRLGVKVSLRETSTGDNPLVALQNLNINVEQKILNNNVSIEKVLTMVDMFMSTAKRAAQAEVSGMVEIKRLPDKKQELEANQRLGELKKKNVKKKNKFSGRKLIEQLASGKNVRRKKLRKETN